MRICVVRATARLTTSSAPAFLSETRTEKGNPETRFRQRRLDRRRMGDNTWNTIHRDTLVATG